MGLNYAQFWLLWLCQLGYVVIIFIFAFFKHRQPKIPQTNSQLLSSYFVNNQHIFTRNIKL